MLSNQQIKKFQTLCKNHLGKKISREEAYEQGAKLIRLVELIYKPMSESEFKKLQKRRKETGDLIT
jgi:urease accessory protein UreF